MAWSGSILFAVFVTFSVGKEAFGVGHRPDQIRAITFNTGLYDVSAAPGLVENNRVQRLDEIIDQLEASKADLICLQEVWLGQDVERIVEDLISVYPYSFSPIHINGTLPPQTNIIADAPCPRSVLIQLANCSSDSGCTNSDNRQELACSSLACPNEIGALLSTSQDCVSCVSVSSENAELGIDRCSSVNSPTFNPRTTNNDGLLMLSKQPLSDGQHFEFFPGLNAINKKGYMYAKYDRNLHVVCTHLTPLISGFAEPIVTQVYGPPADQNRFEVNTLIQKYGGLRPLVLLGDMNIGQAFTNKLSPVSPNAYRILQRGFDTTIPARYCTFCDVSRNAYNVNDVAKSIDHIFGNGIKIVYSKVILTVEMASVQSINGGSYPLSDHYGFEVIFYHPCGCEDPLLRNH